MGLSVFPAAAGGGIKSVQRGSAAGSGNVTITAVDINKSFVTVFGTASSGTVAATGAIGAVNGTTGSGTDSIFSGNSYSQTLTREGGINKFMFNVTTNSKNIALNATNITGGTNNLVAAVVQGFLANSTTLTVSGPCRWEVVEFA